MTVAPGVGQDLAPLPREPRRSSARAARGSTIAVLVAGLAGSVVAGVALGPVPVPVGAIGRVLLAHLTGESTRPGEVRFDAIVWEVRLPRVLLGMLVGAGLALVGTVLQAVLRNPLADPFILGTSAGAGVGAVAVTLGGLAFAGIYTLSVGAFAGALAATVLVFTLSGAVRGAGGARLLLAGVAIYFIAQSVTNLLILTSGEGGQAARAVLFWLLGGLGGARWSSLVIAAAVVSAVIPVLLLRARALDALLLGEQTAASLGLRPGPLRMQLFLVTSLLTGALVAVSGGIGFVGLMIPLFTRLLLRSAQAARVLPVAALLGASFLIWADLLARTVVAPAELPVGLVTALCGGPVFLWMLIRRGGDGVGGLGEAGRP